MENTIKKRSHYMTGDQKKFLVDYMYSHPRLNSGKQCDGYTTKIMHEEWENVALQLNALGGAKKDGKGWKKSWQDLRRNTKIKAADIKCHSSGTGGGPSSTPLNSIQEKVADLLGTAVIHGHSSVEESSCVFDFDDTENMDSEADNGIKILKTVIIDHPTDDILNTPLSSDGAPKFDHRIKGLKSTTDASTKEIVNGTPEADINIIKRLKTTTADNVNEVSNTNKAYGSEAHRSRKRNVTAKERLDKCNITANKIAENSDRKVTIKEEYYAKKLLLLEKLAVAQEKIAECLANYLK